MTISTLSSHPIHVPHHDASISERGPIANAGTTRHVTDGDRHATVTSPQPIAIPPKLDVPTANPNDVKNTLNQMRGLPDQMECDVFAIMAVFQQLSHQIRSSARMVRSAEAQAQVKTQLDAAEKIRDAADKRLTGGIIQGVTQCLSGTTQVVGGFMSAKALSTSQDGYHAAEAARTISDRAAGLNSLASSAGQIGHSIMDKKASNEDAIKAELEAMSHVHEKARTEADEIMRQTEDTMRDIRDKLSAIERSREETQRGIARNL